MTGCMRSGVVTLQRHARGQRIKMFSWNCWFKRIPTDIIVAITVHTYTVMGYFILRTVQNFPGGFFFNISKRVKIACVQNTPTFDAQRNRNFL